MSASLKYSRISDQQHLYNNLKKKNELTTGPSGFKEPKKLTAVMASDNQYKPKKFESIKLNSEHEAGKAKSLGVEDIDIEIGGGLAAINGSDG